MVRVTQKEKVREVLVSSLTENPQGLRYAELMERTQRAWPDMSSNTIRGAIYELGTGDDPDIFKPSPGLYKLRNIDEASVDEVIKKSIDQKKIEESDFYEPFAMWLREDLGECTEAIPLGGTLYGRGVSTRDIQDHLAEIYGMDVSATLISNVTNKIIPLIREWQSRPLCDVYAVVFLDAIHYKVRCEGAITSKAAYMVIGIDLDGQKDVLGMWIGESESSKFWLSVLNEIRNRGTRDILICCTDNLTGFSDAIAAAYPKADIQKCIVHQVRNSIRYVSYKDVKKVCSDLRMIYTSVSEVAALEELDNFEDTWGKKYPLIVSSWRNNWSELSTFFKYPPEIRKIIYTTNIIESYHRQLRKVTKGKSIFPSDEALVKMLYLITQNVMRKWTMRTPNWGQILLQLSIFFPDRVDTQLGASAKAQIT